MRRWSGDAAVVVRTVPPPFDAMFAPSKAMALLQSHDRIAVVSTSILLSLFLFSLRLVVRGYRPKRSNDRLMPFPASFVFLSPFHSTRILYKWPHSASYYDVASKNSARHPMLTTRGARESQHKDRSIDSRPCVYCTVHAQLGDRFRRNTGGQYAAGWWLHRSAAAVRCGTEDEHNDAVIEYDRTERGSLEHSEDTE